MGLSSPRFATSARLRRAAENNPPLRPWDRDRAAVAIVQQALVELGHPMPRSTRPDGSMDGIYGRETISVVRRFQRDRGLGVDGVVGRNTLGKLDELFAASAPSVPAGASGKPDGSPLARHEIIASFEQRYGRGRLHNGLPPRFRGQPDHFYFVQRPHSTRQMETWLGLITYRSAPRPNVVEVCLCQMNSTYFIRIGRAGLEVEFPIPAQGRTELVTEFRLIAHTHPIHPGYSSGPTEADRRALRRINQLGFVQHSSFVLVCGANGRIFRRSTFGPSPA